MDSSAGSPQYYLSYSRRDKALVDEFLGLAKVIAPGFRFFRDLDIRAGARWDEELRRNLAASRAVIFFLSPDALAAEYIWRTEVPLALERSRTDGVSVLPFLLHPCDWKNTPLARFQMLPRSLKPASQTRPRNLAWHELVEALRRLPHGASAPDAARHDGSPAGADRLRLALYAVLSQPAEFELLERPHSSDLEALWRSLDGERRGAAAVFDELAKRHGAVEPNALWAAWIESIEPEKPGPPPTR